jgi:AGZA family xanthine/uracil permease-like MFS transporter
MTGSSFPMLSVLQREVRRSLVTATAASSCIATLLMGVGANLPVALAPGMGLNAYFAYNVVGYRGTGHVRARFLSL